MDVHVQGPPMVIRNLPAYKETEETIRMLKTPILLDRVKV